MLLSTALTWRGAAPTRAAPIRKREAGRGKPEDRCNRNKYKSREPLPHREVLLLRRGYTGHPSWPLSRSSCAARGAGDSHGVILDIELADAKLDVVAPADYTVMPTRVADNLFLLSGTSY